MHFKKKKILNHQCFYFILGHGCLKIPCILKSNKNIFFFLIFIFYIFLPDFPDFDYFHPQAIKRANVTNIILVLMDSSIKYSGNRRTISCSRIIFPLYIYIKYARDYVSNLIKILGIKIYIDTNIEAL